MTTDQLLIVECKALRSLLRTLVYQVRLHEVRQETLDRAEALLATTPAAYSPVPGPPINEPLGRSRQDPGAVVPSSMLEATVDRAGDLSQTGG